jgi:hypothetical protein
MRDAQVGNAPIGPKSLRSSKGFCRRENNQKPRTTLGIAGGAEAAPELAQLRP